MINTMWKIDSSSVTVWMMNGVQKIDSSIPGTIEIVREKTDVLIVYLLLNVERQIAFAYLPKKTYQFNAQDVHLFSGTRF